MGLPILNVVSEPGAGDLLRFFHRTQLHWLAHFAEPREEEYGTIIVNGDLARVHEANQVVSAAVPEGSTAEQVVREVEAIFSEHNSQCYKWTMNPSAPAAQTQALVDHLQRRGDRRVHTDVLYLRAARAGALPVRDDLRIIPARASYRHAREMAEAGALRWHELQLADASMMHLDDPHYDALIAMKDSVAVGEVGVLSVGDLGLIENVFVAEGYRRQGVGTTLMSRALEICARSLFKHVFLHVWPDNAAALALYARAGFAKIGENVSYARV